VKWLPVGPEGTQNGNFGYPSNIKLDQLKLTPDKKLPEEIQSILKEPLR
jgi:hypothetical protein